MKASLVSFLLCFLVGLTAFAQPEGKKIYIPNDLKSNDFDNDSSLYSYKRMAVTKDFVVFWERGFGQDPSMAPDLEGHKMTFDLNNLLRKLQTFYDFYRDSMRFVLPGSKADEYRMMAMVKYSLESTAYGGAYDNVIGALWITPSRMQDVRLNAVAHEVGHSFQSQVICDGFQRGMSGSIYEMTSQWMLWHVNPFWMDDETYHWKDFRRQTHLRFLHNENRYHTAHVQNYWSQKRGLSVMADLFRDCKRHEDCAEAYMRHYGLSLEQMNEEMFETDCHILAMDYERLGDIVKKYAFQIETPCIADSLGWQRPKPGFEPQIWGFDVFPLDLNDVGKQIKVELECLSDLKAGGVVYGLVLVTADGKTVYGPHSSKAQGRLVFPKKNIAKAYLLVMGAPAVYKSYNQRYDQKEEERVFPFRFKLTR